MAISEWFHVSYDDDLVYIHIHAPGQEAHRASLLWKEIIRVCFKTGDFMSPDEIYIFVSSRPESYLIPTEADGGADLWGAIIEKNLFDAELAIKAATAPGDELFCWPNE